VVRADLDRLPAAGVVDALLTAEERVLPAVRAAAPAIARAADLVAERYRAGGRLIFVGAGTAGRLAAAQAAELPGTFGLDRRRVLTRVAGGLASSDADEDDLTAAATDLAQLAPTVGDVVVAVAASGRTPYTVTIARAARAGGADVIALVTYRGTPLAETATETIETVVGEEALRDSTRLGAGTAQKIALDALTTAAGARLGRVHGNLMIDVVGANAKLRQRAAGIVADIAGCDAATAERALAACDGNARAAVLSAVAGLDPGDAARRAAGYETLRAAIEAVSGGAASAAPPDDELAAQLPPERA
jgi:N-acetylmuramic acid 6-phosphate etherase